MIQNSKFKIQNSCRGFTLIELLVVIAIIGILVSIALVNTGKNPDRDVRLEADRLTAFLRDVQSRTFASEKIAGATGKVCGFGVHKYPDSDSELWVYYVETKIDALNPNALDVDCSTVVNRYPNDLKYKVDAFVFGNNVFLDSASSNLDDLFFLSPHGEVSNFGGLPVSISLKKDSTIVNNIVQVDETGRIY